MRDTDQFTGQAVMGAIERSVATLRFLGDDLDPDELSALLGASPTASSRKGQELVAGKSGIARIAKTGSWRLGVAAREPEDLEAQVWEILGQLTGDPGVWKSLSRHEPELFCGLFMAGSNDGLPLSAQALLALGERGIALALDIYDVGTPKAGGAP